MNSETSAYTGLYRLHITLIQAHDLTAKDKGGKLIKSNSRVECDTIDTPVAGTSDPYVKFVLGKATGQEAAAKSSVIKEILDPIWDEEFNIIVDNLGVGLVLRVFHYYFEVI